MDYLNAVASVIGQIVIVGGGGVTIGMGLFKYLGGKWIDSRFEAKAVLLKAQQDVLLADLKAAQDQSLRHVQSTIDREIHRAKKLADREFEVISEGWMLLVKAFDAAGTSGTEFVVQLHKLTDRELFRELERAEMKHWEIDELMALEGEERTKYFRRYEGYKRLNTSLEQRRELARHLIINGIFMPPGMKERFEVLDGIVSACLAEFQARLDTRRSPMPPGFDPFREVKKLYSEGRPLLDALEQEIRGRLWSAASRSGDSPS